MDNRAAVFGRLVVDSEYPSPDRERLHHVPLVVEHMATQSVRCSPRNRILRAFLDKKERLVPRHGNDTLCAGPAKGMHHPRLAIEANRDSGPREVFLVQSP